MLQVFEKPNVYWTLGVFLGYLILNVIISEFYITLWYIPAYLDTLHWGELVLSAFLTLAIAALVAISSVYSYIRYQERKTLGGATATCVSSVVGLSTGVCAACVGSVFPSLLGLFGVTLSFASLPFRGMEVQIATIVVLGGTLYFLKTTFPK